MFVDDIHEFGFLIEKFNPSNFGYLFDIFNNDKLKYLIFRTLLRFKFHHSTIIFTSWTF
jgi:hypothetical protein